MTKTKMLCARAGATAIAAALALSPTYAKPPKPIVDLSKSPAMSEEARPAPAAKPAPAKTGIGPFDEQTLEFGGGALALLALGAGAFALTRRKRRENAETDAYATEAAAAQPRDPLFDEPMFQGPAATSGTAETSAFAWGNAQPCDESLDDGSDRCPGESWVERAHRGPSPANPSASLKNRLSRAAFFDKREREVAAGKAAPVDPDAGLPEAMVEEQGRELEAA